jgi:hypothetical protein
MFFREEVKVNFPREQVEELEQQICVFVSGTSTSERPPSFLAAVGIGTSTDLNKDPHSGQPLMSPSNYLFK